MTAKEHYDKHLGKLYFWMPGDFYERMSEQKEFFLNLIGEKIQAEVTQWEISSTGFRLPSG